MPAKSLAVVVKYFPPYPRISGVLTFVSLLSEQLARAVDVHVVTAALPEGERAAEVVEGCTVHRVGWPFPFTAAAALRRIRPDAVLTVSGIYDLRQGAAYFLPARLAGGAARHAFYQATWPRQGPDGFFRTLARPYDCVLTGSDGITEQFRRAGVGASTLHPAVDVERLESARGTGRSGLRVGFVNHLNRVKGADVASEVIARLSARVPELEFVVAGDGELADELRRRHAGDPRVELLGFLPEDERLRVLASCDVMLLPFRQATSVLGVSQTALEVMALGNVVVGTRTETIERAVEHGRTGVLVDAEGDVATSMVDEVLRLVEDRAMLSRMGSRAREDARDRWDVRRRALEVPALLGLGVP